MTVGRLIVTAGLLVFIVSLLMHLSPLGGDPSLESLEAIEVSVYRNNTLVTRYYLTISGPGTVSVEASKGTEVILRVDAPARFKPVKAAAKPEGACRQVIIEDAVIIHAEERCSVVVSFNERSPKPPVYALKALESKLVKAGENVTLVPWSGWQPWGALVTALTTGKPPTVKAQGPVSLLNVSKREIPTATGAIEAREYVFLVQAESFSVKGDFIAATYLPIYYSPLNTSSEPHGAALYVNEPCHARINVSGEHAVTGSLAILGRFLHRNPRVVVAEGPVTVHSFSPVLVSLPRGYEDLLIVSSLGLQGRGALSLLPSPTEPLVVKVVSPEGDLLAYYEISSFAPEVSLPLSLYNLEVVLTDLDGSRFGGAEVTLYRLLRRTTLTAHNGTVIFERLSPGEYVIVVKYMGVEVARRSIKLDSDSRLIIRCNVRRLRLKVLLADGSSLNKFTAVLKGPATVEANGTDGYLEFPPLPAGTYNLMISSDGKVVWSTKISLSKTSDFTVMLPLRHVTVKVVSTMGTPISGAKVALLSEGREVYATVTSSDGRAVIPLVRDGNYTVLVEIGGVTARYPLSVAGTGRVYLPIRVEVVALVFGVAITPDILTATILVVTILLIAVTIARKLRKREELVVLEAD